MSAASEAGIFPFAAHRTYVVFVQSDDDMVGHIAYALYKRDKIKFLESIRDRHEREASQMEIDAFIQGSNLGTRVGAYRGEAERMLEGFSETSLDVSLREAQEEMDRRLVQQLKQAKSWWRAVGENLVANLLAIAVTTLLVVIVYASRVGAAKLLADTFGYEIREKSTVSEPVQPR